jgi:hypothetical protein
LIEGDIPLHAVGTVAVRFLNGRGQALIAVGLNRPRCIGDAADSADGILATNAPIRCSEFKSESYVPFTPFCMELIGS